MRDLAGGWQRKHPVESTRRRERQRGSEQLELAFVVVALFTLVFGIFWFARAYNVHESMTRAAREGARMAAMPNSFAQGNTFLDGDSVGKSGSAVFAQYIAPALRSANLDPEQVTNYSEQVTWLNPGDTDRQCGVVISFEFPFTFQIPFTTLNVSTIRLRAHAQMRRENQSATGTCP
jgi:hypothetical protein